ncbi:glutathione-regulated potassium-efflux system protein KefC [Synechocystis sp. LKSZ1]|uniref:glutathione-regulated potassium-efflux system protein KefC n=1 Tax=Synechocystis sp. LKSZ1 TaxID=3144951 RepID=UPI00336C2581
MHNQDFFFQAFIYLGAAVISVPIAKRLGLGSVLGYLMAGILIGPFGFHLVGQNGEDVLHFAEFGVVMMLFLVGLELQPALLWRLRVPILGLGGLQVLGTSLVVASLGLLIGLPWQSSLAVGLILAMSSTAIVLQTLNEKGWMKTEAGQSAFSVLLFQDIAVIPILALLPLLAITPTHQARLVSSTASPWLNVAQTTQASLPPWQQTLLVIVTVGGIILAGRFLMQPVFRFIATTGLRELFTATALFLVIAITLAMNAVGLSPALGTFVAGVVLAENEYRHELETDIEPFKGLLLGLFFISVGASIDFSLLFQNPWLILSLVIGLALIKGLVLFVLSRIFRLELGQGLLFSFALAQGGEFAFVLFSFTLQNNVLTSAITAPLVVAIALSMALTPVLIIGYEQWVYPRFRLLQPDREADLIDEDNPVIIAGFGRFGQIVGRLLIANGVRVTILDHDPSHIDLLRRFGWKVFYGDAARIDLLRAAGIGHARLLIIAIDEPEKTLGIIHAVQKYFPQIQILARATNRQHAYDLIRAGVQVIERETFGSSLAMGVTALQLLGMRAYKAQRVAQTFKDHDEQVLREMAFMAGDKIQLMARSRQMNEELAQLLQSDDQEIAHLIDHAWDASSLYAEGKDESPREATPG